MSEKRELKTADCSIVVRLLETSEHILRDRKILLHFCGIVAGENGLAALDHTSQLFWPRESLRDELSHDADVDISGIYVLHEVHEAGSDNCFWLHSHGLGEIGYWDFDILRPGQELLARGSDTFRALAFLSVEGKLHPRSGAVRIFHPMGSVSPISAPEFQRRCGSEDRVIRQPHECHEERRVVLCEPNRGLLRGLKKLEPSYVLSGDFPDGAILSFSREATRLMAERAQATYGVLRKFAAEFADLRFPTLVKMGFQTDDQADREHLWFEAKSLKDASVTATLVNTALGIRRMTAGTSGEWSLENLSDWIILTPKGSITPANFGPARDVRADRDEVARIMSESGLPRDN